MSTQPTATTSPNLLNTLNSSTLSNFKGQIIYGTTWQNHYDLSGKRVAVISAGASAVHLIPCIVQQAAKLKVFQRSAPWILPKFTHNKLLRYRTAVFEMIPQQSFSALEARIAHYFLKQQIGDTWLRRQLTPSQPFNHKQLGISNDYYTALQQPNCELITWPIAQITETGIQTSEGLIHEVDCIVCTTYDGINLRMRCD